MESLLSDDEEEQEQEQEQKQKERKQEQKEDNDENKEDEDNDEDGDEDEDEDDGDEDEDKDEDDNSPFQYDYNSKTPDYDDMKTPENPNIMLTPPEENNEEDEEDQTPDIYVQFERRGFMDVLNRDMKKYKAIREDKEFDQDACKNRKGKKSDFEPFRHQKLVRDFLHKDTPYRGAVFYHGLGSGKTCSSITVAEALKTEKDVVVMLPKSLRGNYTKQLMECGDVYFRKSYKWLINQEATPEEAARETGFSVKTTRAIIDHIGGFFYIDEESGLKVSEMSADNREKLDFQIIQLLNEKYKFIHYNGLREKDVKKFKEGGDNYFNNKVIIIDEYHNLISAYVNQSKIIREIYNMIMRAKNIKIVALSGTPIINSPEELSAIVNLVAGTSKVYTVSLDSNRVNYEAIKEFLETSKYVHYYNIKPRENVIEIVPHTEDFVNVFDGRILLGLRRDGNTLTDKQKIDDVLDKIKQDGMRIIRSSVKPKLEKRLPDDFDEFVRFFVDTNKNEIKNGNLFMRRILGTISYYSGNVTELLPARSELNIIKVPFSDYQIQYYDKVRDDERKMERKKKGGRKKADANIQQAKAMFKIQANTFKVFSRQACNFVFPEGLDRPYPKDYRDDDGNDGAYKEAMIDTLEQLKDRADEDLVGENLKKYSPKYYEIVNRVNESEGPALAYSQFISMEGLDALGVILDANGYQELRLEKAGGNIQVVKGADYDEEKPKYVKYTGREDAELREIMLDIYNDSMDRLPQELQKEFEGRDNLHGDIIKLLMISSSGAEGLDLKNIRQIHIIEPYWNNVRIQQVIGRGIRVCSHMDLPLEQRYVELFMYITEMTEEQAKLYQTLTLKDKKETTDETILKIASRKEELINQLLELIKRASFDCGLNSAENDVKNCFKHPRKENGEMDIMIKPFLRDEQKDSDIKQVNKETQKDTLPMKRKRLGNGKTIIIINNDTNVYDGEVYDNEKKLEVIGKLVTEKGKVRVVMN